MRPLAAAAVALAILAVVLIYAREPAGVDKAPRPEPPVETIESVPEVDPEPLPLPPPRETPARPVSRPRPRGPIERLEPIGPHFWVMNRIVAPRLDAVDQCRERFTLPPMQQLLARSTVIPELGVGTRVQEAALQQTFVFEISTSDDTYVIDDVEVTESSLEFPAPDGTMRRLSFDDAALDRCLEGVLRGSRLESNGAANGERFWVEGRAGEAVYDLPPR
jgi:hypothetical protein